MTTKLLKSFFILCLTFNLAHAGETPLTISGAKLVNAQEAKAAMDKGAKMIDTRVRLDFATEHIEGAVNVVYNEKSAKTADFDMSVDTFDLSKLPGDKTTTLIMYCNGPTCWRSYKSSMFAVKAGYTNILWLRNGIHEWKAAGLPTK